MSKAQTVADFLTRDVRARFRARGVTSQQLTNWKARATIPARQLPLLEDVCAEMGIKVPRHLVHLERVAS